MGSPLLAPSGRESFPAKPYLGAGESRKQTVSSPHPGLWRPYTNKTALTSMARLGSALFLQSSEQCVIMWLFRHLELRSPCEGSRSSVTFTRTGDLLWRCTLTVCFHRPSSCSPVWRLDCCQTLAYGKMIIPLSQPRESLLLSVWTLATQLGHSEHTRLPFLEGIF